MGTSTRQPEQDRPRHRLCRSDERVEMSSQPAGHDHHHRTHQYLHPVTICEMYVQYGDQSLFVRPRCCAVGNVVTVGLIKRGH